MRVLDTQTGHFVQVDPKDRKIKYAILSHTWRPKGEQTYQQLRDIQRLYTPSANGNSYDDYSSSDEDSPSDSTLDHQQPLVPIWAHPKLSSKTREAGRVAREKGYRYLWIDSCCIDKTSSSELSESINSMYQWYALADICYAFLADVMAGEDHEAENSRFRGSRWFTRAWTLQELIAPCRVTFLAKDWTEIGSKHSLEGLITEITKIKSNALLNPQSLGWFSVAQRFSWAAERQATRVEDRAYSLLGIFDINMPTLYGEGDRAFRRLQEEIMRRTPDQSLFAWTESGVQSSLSPTLHDDLVSNSNLIGQPFTSKPSFIAPSLDVFRGCGNIIQYPHSLVLRQLNLTTSDLPAIYYDFTPYGICVKFPVLQFKPLVLSFPLGGFKLVSKANRHNYMSKSELERAGNWHMVILGCGAEGLSGHLLGRICWIEPQRSTCMDFLYSPYIEDHGSEVLLLTPENIAHFGRSFKSQILTKSVCIPPPFRLRADVENKRSLKFILTDENGHALSTQGYTTTIRGQSMDTNDYPTDSESVTLAHDTHTISIDFQYTLDLLSVEPRAETLEVEAHVKTSTGVHQICPGGHGQGTVVSWSDRYPWSSTLGTQNVQGSMLSVGLAHDPDSDDVYVINIKLDAADA